MLNGRPSRETLLIAVVLAAVAFESLDTGFIYFLNGSELSATSSSPSLYTSIARVISLVLLCIAVGLSWQVRHANRRLRQNLQSREEALENCLRQNTTRLQTLGAKIRREVKARRHMEATVRESEEKYRLLVENANEAIFILQDDQIKFTNPKAEEIFNRLAIQPSGAALAKCIHPNERDRVIEWYQRRLEGRELPYSLMFRLEGEHRASIWVELNSILIKLNGEAATLNFIRDVTLQKKLEEQFYQSQKMESIGTLAGGIAHDFNNLLMGIQGNVSVMNLEAEGGGPLQESLQSIERCVQSGSQLTNQLLAFARGGKYIVKPCNLNSIVNKASEIFGRTKREVNIHRVFARDIWSVEVDSGQIEQVLMNLFVNAWQAMPDGGDLFIEIENVELDDHYTRIKPYNIRPGRYVKLSVTDTGVGMDTETRKRIFEPFFSTKEKGMGTGLGLASAYGIVKNHGGFINCYSEVGHGTTFNIYFPESEKAIVDEERGRDDELVTGVPGGGETILFIDDEDEILAVGRKILGSLGYRVITAPDGKTSLEIYTDRGDEIDLVVLDYVMPGMGGREVFETLLRIDPDVRVLLSSGYSSNNQVAHMLENGCKGFIQKPYDAVRMARKIREILDA
ncbi:MAG: ATP-binding protein [Desulfobacterales bacterium]|nr:ATP-binding protein [Desulfobacterales bacterium]